MKHSLDVDIAKEYGVAEALILNNICFWTSYHKANGTNYHDGRFWVYNSYRAWTVLFPYYSEKQIRRALESLVEKEILVKGNYNKRKFDKTLWYALSDKGLELTKRDVSICPLGQMDLTLKADGFDLEDRPIPIINTNINTDNTTITDGSDNLAKLVVQWSNNIHPIVPREKDELEALLEECGYSNVEQAINIAVDSGHRNISYIRSTARNLANGIDLRDKKEKQEEPKQEESTLSPEQRRVYDKLVAEMKAKKNGN